MEIIETGDVDEIVVNIPECCRKGLPECPHAIVESPRGKKTNIGM